MKRKDEEVVTPDSANISDMQTNDDDDERAESRERSRGKRRTAREIASMFEQLKQRHITRKKEWQDEKDDLVKKVQMAEESKKVLSDLKGILESLREELKHEEKKRIEMEIEHESEKRDWEVEREDLFKRIEQSANESDKDGTHVTALTEKLAEQSQHIAEWQSTVLDLKKQLLERENRFLRERRELQLELEKERASWKRKEMLLSERIRSLDAKSGQSSASSISPTATPQPPVDVDLADESAAGKPRASEQIYRKTSSSSVQEASSKYNNFQKTVDNALKQIEKISNDLKDIDEPKLGTTQLHQGTRRSSLTPSPNPISSPWVLKTGSPESDPSVTAPWRTKKRSTTSRPQIADIASDATRKATTPKSRGRSSVEFSSNNEGLLPAINTTQLKMSSRSPNPERKVKKINRKGNQVDVVVSSPDSTTQQDVKSQPMSDHGSPTAHGRVQVGDRDNAPNTATPSPVPFEDHRRRNEVRHARIASRDESFGATSISPQTTTDGGYSHSSTRDSTTTPSKNKHGSLSIHGSEGSRERSNSPRLPKLHQQLLFRKDFVFQNTGGTQDDHSSAADGRKTSTDEPKPKHGSSQSEVRRNISVDKSEPTHPSAPYNVDRRRNPTSTVAFQEEKPANQTGSAVKAESKTQKPHIGGALVSLGTSLVQGQKNEGVVPPLVHPKPKVSFHKDFGGNIVRVSPEVGQQEPLRKSASPESIPGSEKHHSIAGRVGKAGRDWIRKKLSFRDKKGGEELESDEKNRVTPSTGDTIDENKRHGKSKSRSRSSSLLRNGKHAGKSGGRRGIAGSIDPRRSSSDDSTESDREEKKRESFLRRSRKKGKKASVAGMEAKVTSPTKSRPRKYTRSKTEASPKDMKNFLAKFKASQSNPNKPSVVKQFEKKLLENEIKTFQEFQTDSQKDKRQGSDGIRNGNKKEAQQKARKNSFDEGYSGEDEEDFDNLSRGDLSSNDADKSVASPTRAGDQDDVDTPNSLKSGTRIGKKGPPVKPKTYYRRSMSDFKHFEEGNDSFHSGITPGSNIPNRRRRDRSEPKFISDLPTIHSPSSAAQEADVICSRKAVSSLVDKFSLNENNKGDRVPEQANIARGLAARYSLRDPAPKHESIGPQDGAIQRSRSMSSHDAAAKYNRKRSTVALQETDPLKNMEATETAKSTTSHRHTSRSAADSWLDRVMSKPAEEVNGVSKEGDKDFVRSHRTSAPPGKYDFLENSYVSGHSTDKKPEFEVQTSPKPGRMKMMSAEMRRKADMLEKALVKGPRRPRRYKRADTQPVHSYYGSSNDDYSSDTEGDLDRAFQPFIAEFEKADGLQRRRTMPENTDKENEGLHDIIPPVTSKFSKPTRPGRLPSRWAR